MNAGEDTTAHTLAWTVWFLASRPNVQERLAEEADVALGQDDLPTDHILIEQLDYCEAVIRESMRLKTVGPASAPDATSLSWSRRRRSR